MSPARKIIQDVARDRLREHWCSKLRARVAQLEQERDVTQDALRDALLRCQELEAQLVAARAAHERIG